MKAAVWVSVGASALLAGCTVGPDYQRPAAVGRQPLPAAFTGGTTNTGSWKVAQPAAHVPRGPWWQSFGDGELNRLESLAGANQDVAAAVARFAQARALINVARADLFPQIAATPTYNRQRNSDSQLFASLAGIQYATYTVPLQAGWEADLWGRVRRQVEAARANLSAAADDVQAVRLAVEAEVATDFFTLRALDDEDDLLTQTAAAYRRSLELTRNRRVGGVASDLDVAQAQTQLQTTEAQLPAVDLQRTKLRHALATLCGQPATGFAVAAGQTNWAKAWTNPVPTTVPSELLERRPDIAAAERRMAAANAEVGVAQAAFYPRIQFHGLAGLQAIDANSVFDWPSRFWAVGPALELPLFTGGRLHAQLAAARAGYEATVAQYRQTVLSAFQEVEDQLAAQRLLAAELASTTAALTAARHTLEIANNRYVAGLVTYLEVAVAQSAALDQERAVVQLRAEARAAAVGLVKALGGGWEQRSVAVSAKE